ncbi:MAG: aminodeoxychorismate lyase, partial [Actinobacteria bacterium]|nr:endolytic transglycosylase MltG [Actinomycetota bacterium]NIS34910.1 endolytic transglycosylase MltG [Actinomycetota bacterium]NIU69657.1 endolytic transglycosylase MltG [Actinomycetota bacterium]NIW31523.1 aminodeoxychorismate lyase [Actinomycetota bacterium]NIX23866.1 aminodeoxychorismate lyase [Actinomycetota bacterium]
GSTLGEIGTILTDADVVASRDAFVTAANNHPEGRSIQAGDYTLMRRMSAADAVATLVERAETPEVRVT